jgi:hypothetical protein
MSSGKAAARLTASERSPFLVTKQQAKPSGLSATQKAKDLILKAVKDGSANANEWW